MVEKCREGGRQKLKKKNGRSRYLQYNIIPNESSDDFGGKLFAAKHNNTDDDGRVNGTTADADCRDGGGGAMWIRPRHLLCTRYYLPTRYIGGRAAAGRQDVVAVVRALFQGSQLNRSLPSLPPRLRARRNYRHSVGYSGPTTFCRRRRRWSRAEVSVQQSVFCTHATQR